MNAYRIIACLLLWCALAAGAEEQHLVSTSSDKDARVETFAVELDRSGRLSKLWHREPAKADRSYTLEQLRQGVVLKLEEGEEAVRFRATEVDAERGGTFRMDYLFSGVPPRQYKSMAFDLRKHDGVWRLFSGSDKRPIKGLHFLTNVATFLGLKKIVGIRAVEFQR